MQVNRGRCSLIVMDVGLLTRERFFRSERSLMLEKETDGGFWGMRLVLGKGGKIYRREGRFLEVYEGGFWGIR